MTKLDDILQEQERATKDRQSAVKKLEKLQRNIVEGKETTGDVMRDFCIVHNRTDNTKVSELHQLTDKIVAANGKPILVHTKFFYQYPESSHGDGDYDCGAHELFRFGICAEPKWNFHQLEISDRYAYEGHQCSIFGGSHEFFSKNGHYPRLMYDWKAQNTPLVLAAAEFFDKWFAWTDMFTIINKQIPERADLASGPRKLLDDGPLNWRNEKGQCKTHILVGDEAEKFFRDHCRSRTRDKEKYEYDSRSYDEAMCCVTHGMNIAQYEKKIAKELLEKQTVAFKNVVDASFAQSDSLPELLRVTEKLDVHNTTISYSPRTGVRVDAKEFLPELYRIQNINDVVKHAYEVAATLEDEK